MFFRGIFKNFSLNKRSFFIEDSFFPRVYINGVAGCAGSHGSDDGVNRV